MTAKSKEVTRESFEIFLGWLSPEQENQGREYEKLRIKLTTFFAARRCFYPDELADEVINRMAVIIGGEVIENKIGYVYAVARNVYLESLRKEKRHVNIDDVSLAATAPAEDDFSGECLEKCLRKLPGEKREFILKYFSEEKSEKVALHKKTSGEMQISRTALRMRAHRVKEQLSDCVKTCMKN